MNNKFITLAIHSSEKAIILKNILEERGISVFLERVNDTESNSSALDSYYVKIKDSDLSKALTIIESDKLFSYSDKETYKVDDGRKRILVAVDFSPYSMKACQVAFNIAKERNAKVKILHIFHNIYFPSHIPFADSLKENPDDGLLSKIRGQMLKFCTDIEKKISDGLWPSINYSYSIREGIIDEEIENFVQEYKPTLIVLGTKGKDNNTSSMLGSVTADIIETINVPVLAVPESSPINSISDIKHIVFLTNLQDRDIVSFDKFVYVMRSYENIKITLLHINRINTKGDKWPEAELAKMSEYFKERYPQFNINYLLIDSPNMLEVIKDFIQKERVTVIALNTRRRNFLGRIFAPSFSRKVLTMSDKALLVLRG